MGYRKCVIYGAGALCEKLLVSNLIDISDVVCIIDRDVKKTEKQLCGVSVCSPSKLMYTTYNWVIITTRPRNFYDVFNTLINDLYVPRDKIVFYDPEDELILTDIEASGYAFRFNLFQRYKKEFIMGELLSEAAINNEFEEFNRIIVCGKFDVAILKCVYDFFEVYLNKKIVVEKEEKGIHADIQKNDKLLLVTKTADEDVQILKEKYKYDPEQLLVIPFP